MHASRRRCVPQLDADLVIGTRRIFRFSLMSVCENSSPRRVALYIRGQALNSVRLAVHDTQAPQTKTALPFSCTASRSEGTYGPFGRRCIGGSPRIDVNAKRGSTHNPLGLQQNRYSIRRCPTRYQIARRVLPRSKAPVSMVLARQFTAYRVKLQSCGKVIDC